MEKSQTVEFMFVVCGDGGKGPVLTNPLVKLRLDTEESLEIVTGEVQVGHVTANNVWTNLKCSNIIFFIFLNYIKYKICSVSPAV